MSWTFRFSMCVTFAAALVTASSLSAQQQPGAEIGAVTLFGEENLKVQASTKTEIPISKAPGSVTVISARQIRESSARTVPDLLRFVGGVNVRWNPMVQTIDIQGFGENPFSNRILILIDGVPYNSADTGGFPLSPALDLFPVKAIKRIEIVRGAGSSLYGENAFWGVINIVTFSGEDIQGGAVEILAGDRGTGQLSALYGARIGEGSLFASARYGRTAFPMRFFEESDSEIRASDAYLKAAWKGFQLSYYRHDDDLDGFTESFPPETGFPPGSAFRSASKLEQTVDIVALKYDTPRKDARITYGADVSYAHRDGMHCAACHALKENDDFANPEDHGYQLLGDFRVGLHMIPSHDVLVGIEGRRIDRGDHSKELDPSAKVNGYKKLAIYAQDQFSTLRDKLRFVVGLRYDGSNDLFDAETSPRLSIVALPNDRLVVRGSYSTAFRFPTFSEMFQNTWFLGLENDLGLAPPFPLAVFAPNPNLKPEKIRTFEIGGEYLIAPGISARADIHQSTVQNFVVIAVATPPPPNLAAIRFENHPADATLTGGQVELKANLKRWLNGFVNWNHENHKQDGQGVDSTGKPLEFVYAPKNKINMGVYAGPWKGFSTGVEVAWRDEVLAPSFWYNISGAPIEPLDAYTLVNARIGYDLPFDLGSPSRSVRFNLYIDDILDEQPTETLIGVNTQLPGREVFGAVEIHF